MYCKYRFYGIYFVFSLVCSVYIPTSSSRETSLGTRNEDRFGGLGLEWWVLYICRDGFYVHFSVSTVVVNKYIPTMGLGTRSGDVGVSVTLCTALCTPPSAPL